jgi:hypothetical protein
MSSKLLVSMLALGLATGSGAALAQATGGTEKPQGTGMQLQTGGAQMQSQTSTGDETTTSGHKGTQSRQTGKQMGQSGQENAPSGTQTRQPGGKQMGQAGEENAPSGTQTRRPGEMKRGQAEKQGQGTMQGQGSMQGSTGPRTTRGTETKGQAAATGETSTGKAQGASGSASLTSEQRGRITEVFKKENIRPEANVNFSLSVGTPVPRTVRLHRLPREIVEVEPRWRPYEFLLVGDEIVIVNPRTFEIVAVMPA